MVKQQVQRKWASSPGQSDSGLCSGLRAQLALTVGLKNCASQLAPEAALGPLVPAQHPLPAFVALSWHQGPSSSTRKFRPMTFTPQPGQGWE